MGHGVVTCQVIRRFVILREAIWFGVEFVMVSRLGKQKREEKWGQETER